MTGEKMSGFTRHKSPAGVYYYTFDCVINFKEDNRNCIYCGRSLEKNQVAIGVLTNCDQEVKYPIPRNFFIHKGCAGNLGKTLDELTKEYQIMLMVMEQFGKRWKLSMGR
ncbi:MAG: hypothetical protein PHN69_07775 [Candidatus Pacebacteria bacterium]|nr:hypothetical protein [Candidatus Paceibacterota bacterium]